jgi:hypothetical protein
MYCIEYNTVPLTEIPGEPRLSGTATKARDWLEKVLNIPDESGVRDYLWPWV